jgi:hypothetical protein
MTAGMSSARCSCAGRELATPSVQGPAFAAIVDKMIDQTDVIPATGVTI